MIPLMIMVIIMMTEPYDYDNIDDDNGHKNDSYTAGAGPLVLVPWFEPLGPIINLATVQA